MDPSIKRGSSADIDDRISQLPDELLISIISSLTMKQATATSILSKRWKTLWTYFYGYLDFDDEYKSRLQKTYFDSEYIYRSGGNSNYIMFEQCTGKYIDYVNKVLNSHKGFGVPVNKLRICWSLGSESEIFVDSWIDFVMKNRVQHFELDFESVYSYINYEIPLETLTGTTRTGFSNLSVLRLNSVYLTDEALAYLLSSDNCPLLQHISVKDAGSFEHVKVVGNLKLKSLEFLECLINDIEISSTVNLVSFGFIGEDTTKLTFENVPLLTEALFGGEYWRNVVSIPISQQLLSISSQLEILRLDFLTFYSHYVPSQFPKFDKVKHLEVEAYTTDAGVLNIFFMAMIYGCPRLQKFSLKMIYNGDIDSDIFGDGNGSLWGFGQQDIRYQHQHECLHECLQAVEFKGWDGNKEDLELITDLLNISVNLHKVTIDPRTKFTSKEHELQVITRCKEFLIPDKMREEGARKAAEELRTILPQKVSLVLL